MIGDMKSLNLRLVSIDLFLSFSSRSVITNAIGVVASGSVNARKKIDHTC
jgi:hypothetical protein